MKVFLICSMVLVAGSAKAQATAPTDWTGLYVGANFSASSADVVDDLDSTEVFTFTAKGNAAGVQVGYNLQNGAFVVGLEGSLSYGSLSGTGECPPLTCAGTGSQPAIDIDRTTALRARLGLAHNNLLYFATVGAGFAEASVNDPFQGGNDSQRHRGVLAGVGVDWKLSQNLSAGAEYIYGRYNDIPYALVITPDVIGFETRELRLGVKLSF